MTLAKFYAIPIWQFKTMVLPFGSPITTMLVDTFLHGATPLNGSAPITTNLILYKIHTYTPSSKPVFLNKLFCFGKIN
jgi:hypothetical protein